MSAAYPQNDPQIVWNPYTQRYERAQPQPMPNTAWGGNPAPVPQTAQNTAGGLPTIHRVVWGQGMEAAKSVPLSPNENVMIIDSESDRFYIAGAGPDGRPRPLEAFTYAKETTSSGNGDYVTRKEFDELKASLAALTGAQTHEEKEGE